jgi:serine/threonine-protein kinase
MSLLGEGGMGSVWVARNEALDVDVAIKLIRCRASEEASDRLLSEARAAARIGHPSIVRVFDFGQSDRGEPFIVMELLAGESLRSLLVRKRRLSATSAVRTLLPIAAALRAAHHKGIVHRDIKPENILLAEGESGGVTPKIVDFGIAKLRPDDVDRQVTQEDVVLGSPDYMSPEQARGIGSVDGRSDVWSLCVVIYEAITGKVPFAGANYNALLESIVSQAPTPATTLCDSDEALWRILERGLAKDRGARWPNVQELGRALASWAIERGVDTDITGASIALQWLQDIARRPFSDPPPPEAPVFGHPSAPDTIYDPVPTGSRTLEDAVPSLQPKSSRLATIVGVSALAFAAALGLRSRLTRPPEPAAVTATATATAAVTATATATAAATAAATATVTAAATAPATEPATVIDPSACAIQQFAPDAFPPGADVDLSWICAETDPRRGASSMKRLVVQFSSSDRLTNAMREWALLHWYEMASFAIVRTRCCASPDPLSLPPPIGTCEALDRTLDDVGGAAAGRGDVEPALARLRVAISCAIASGAASDYSYRTLPPGGAETALRALLARHEGWSAPAP